MSGVMKTDVSGARKVNSLTDPITGNPVPAAMESANKAVAAFQAKVEEKAFAALVLASALSRAFRREWLDAKGAIQAEANPIQGERGGNIRWVRLAEVGLQPDLSPENCSRALETFF